MAISLYDVTIPVFQRGLGSLGAVLNKGRAFAATEGMDQAELLDARLAPDMLSLTGQVQRASDTAKGALVQAYAKYLTSADGQQAAAASAKSAPMTGALLTKAEAAAATIK